MSFAFLPLYTGDYLRDTRHLTPTRHGIYLLLLMHCWDQKGPVPLDEQEAAGIANCRSADEIDALRYVLSRYFVKLDDGHYNKRMSEEVSRAENLSDLRSKAGQKSAKVRAKTRSATRVQQVLNKSSAQVGTPTPTLTPTTTPTPTPPTSIEVVGEKTARASARLQCPDSVKQQTWDDWLAVRKAKRAGPVTQTVLEALEREAQKVGFSLQSAIQVCAERGWQGLNAEWLERDRPAGGKPKSERDVNFEKALGRTGRRPDVEAIDV